MNREEWITVVSVPETILTERRTEDDDKYILYRLYEFSYYVPYVE